MKGTRPPGNTEVRVVSACFDGFQTMPLWSKMLSDKITRLYINMNTYKAQARTGLLLLKEVVLDVLLDAQDEGVMLQSMEIKERIGIPDGKEPSKRSSLILGVLYHLESEGRVSQTLQGGTVKWKINEEEASARKTWK